MSFFTDRLNELINSTHITKKKFLEDNGLSKNAIYMWEDRDNIPKHDKLVKMAAYFNVSVDYLIGKTDSPEQVLLNSNDFNLTVLIKEKIRSGELSREDMVKIMQMLTEELGKG